MQIIPIADTYSQTLNINLGGQICQINLYQKFQTELFCDLYMNDVLVIGGVRCRNMVRIVRNIYLGFVGDLMFADQQGTFAPPSTGIDPSSPGLGTQFLFCYLTPEDLNGVG